MLCLTHRLRVLTAQRLALERFPALALRRLLAVPGVARRQPRMLRAVRPQARAARRKEVRRARRVARLAVARPAAARLAVARLAVARLAAARPAVAARAARPAVAGLAAVAQGNPARVVRRLMASFQSTSSS